MAIGKDAAKNDSTRRSSKYVLKARNIKHLQKLLSALKDYRKS